MKTDISHVPPRFRSVVRKAIALALEGKENEVLVVPFTSGAKAWTVAKILQVIHVDIDGKEEDDD